MADGRDDEGATGPEAAGDYEGPGYPTVGERRRHLRTLALLAGGAALVAGGKVGYEKLVEQEKACGGDPPPVKPGKDGWLGTRTTEPPPRLMGEMAIPEHEPDPRVKGDIAVAIPEPFTEAGPEPVHIPEEYPGVAGGIQAPEHYPDGPGDVPEPIAIDPEPPRVRGKIAMPSHPPGGDPTDPDAPLPPKPEICTIPPATDPDAGTGTVGLAVTSKLRDVYLSGSTGAGRAFSVLVRLDPGDEASYEAVIQARKRILAALAPLAEDATLAKGARAYRTVTSLVPGAVIRDAGVVR